MLVLTTQAYIGIAGGFTFPLVFFVLFDLYYKAYWIYQLFLAGAAWNWGFLLAIEMNNCGVRLHLLTCG